MNNEEIIQEVLQGHLTSPKWPTPRLVKIFIASTRSDFAEERRQLLEVVGPELQSKYDHIGLEVELVDMHFGAEVDPALDAPLFEDHQHEVRECHRVSRGCFFLCLVGNKYGPCPLPARLDGDAYEALYATAVDMGLKAGLLDTWFGRNDSAYVLQQPSDVTTPEWRATCQEVAGVVGTAARRLAEAELRTPPARFRHLTYSAVERHFSQALGLAPGTAHRILAVVRDWEKLDDKHPDFVDVSPEGGSCTQTREQLKNFRDRLAASLPNENRIYLATVEKLNEEMPLYEN